MRRAAAALAACLASAAASAQAPRGGTSELSISPVYTRPKDYGFPVGASARTEPGFGLGVQWHYNFDGHWAAGLDAEFSSAEYVGTAAPSAPSATPSFSFDAINRTSTVRLAFDYNFSESQFTPFVTGGVGLAFVDAGLPPGSAFSGCAWYPWSGQVCGGSVPSKTQVLMTYSGGVGVRYDMKSESYFFRAVYDTVWINYGASAGGKRTSDQFRIDFGVRF